MRLAFALAALCFCVVGGSSARALVVPQPGSVDPHIQTVFYNPEQVVGLRAYLGYQLMIEFGPGERIENVSIGDAMGWQVTPNKKASLLFLKPIDLTPPTNMTVVTDRRRYAFELSARAAAKARPSSMAYVVRFTYPPEPLPPPVAEPPPPQPPERRNLAYRYTGSRAALPSLVFDDGKFTYFQWPEGNAVPAIFLLGADGSESIANYGVRQGYVVVEQLAPRFLIRNGKDVTTLINEGWREPPLGPLAPKPYDAKTARDAGKTEGRR